jgi:hypothetical protein
VKGALSSRPKEPGRLNLAETRVGASASGCATVSLLAGELEPDLRHVVLVDSPAIGRLIDEEEAEPPCAVGFGSDRALKLGPAAAISVAAERNSARALAGASLPLGRRARSLWCKFICHQGILASR